MASVPGSASRGAPPKPETAAPARPPNGIFIKSITIKGAAGGSADNKTLSKDGQQQADLHKQKQSAVLPARPPSSPAKPPVNLLGKAILASTAPPPSKASYVRPSNVPAPISPTTVSRPSSKDPTRVEAINKTLARPADARPRADAEIKGNSERKRSIGQAVTSGSSTDGQHQPKMDRRGSYDRELHRTRTGNWAEEEDWRLNHHNDLDDRYFAGNEHRDDYSRRFEDQGEYRRHSSYDRSLEYDHRRSGNETNDRDDRRHSHSRDRSPPRKRTKRSTEPEDTASAVDASQSRIASPSRGDFVQSNGMEGKPSTAPPPLPRNPPPAPPPPPKEDGELSSNEGDEDSQIQNALLDSNRSHIGNVGRPSYLPSSSQIRFKDKEPVQWPAQPVIPAAQYHPLRPDNNPVGSIRIGMPARPQQNGPPPPPGRITGNLLGSAAPRHQFERRPKPPPTYDATRPGDMFSRPEDIITLVPGSMPFTNATPEERAVIEKERDSNRANFRNHMANMVGCSSLNQNYHMAAKIGEGTFGIVNKAIYRPLKRPDSFYLRDPQRAELGLESITETCPGASVLRQGYEGQVVAVKRIILHSAADGMPITSLREIRLLKLLNHPNIVPVLDIAYDEGDQTTLTRGNVYMVFPYMAHDLAGILDSLTEALDLGLIKLYARQLLDGTAYLHRHSILHRDMKTANLLIDNKGCLQIADFGLARSLHTGKEQQETQQYTNMVVTRWYRPPELLLGERRYTTAVDMWGVGCVLAEMFLRTPIFRGESEIDQCRRIFEVCGSPTHQTMPNYDRLPGIDGIVWEQKDRRVHYRFSSFRSKGLAEIMDELLVLDPAVRLTAEAAMGHQWFWSNPPPMRVQDVKPFPDDCHEFDKRKKDAAKAHAQQQMQRARVGQPSSAQRLTAPNIKQVGAHRIGASSLGFNLKPKSNPSGPTSTNGNTGNVIRPQAPMPNRSPAPSSTGFSVRRESQYAGQTPKIQSQRPRHSQNEHPDLPY